MRKFSDRRLATIDLDRVLGGAATAVATVRAGAMPSEVKEMLLRHTGQGSLSSETEVDPGTGATTHAATTTPHAATPAASHAASTASHSASDSSSETGDQSDTTGSGAAHRSGGSHRSSGSTHHASSSSSETEPDTDTGTSSNYHPTAANAGGPTANVPLPMPRPDFEGQQQQNQFMQQDTANRAQGYYGAFGDAPTGSATSGTYPDETQHGRGAAAQHNGLDDIPLPQYPTEAPVIDTTGVQQKYSDADLANNRASLGDYQDSASPAPAPVHVDDLPPPATQVASLESDPTTNAATTNDDQSAVV